MSWRYRVIRRVEPLGEESYGIHEVFNIDSPLDSWTVDPMDPHGETLRELQKDLKMMDLAFYEPILEEYMDGDTQKLREYDAGRDKKSSG